MDVTSSPVFKVLTTGLESYVFELLSKHLSNFVHLSREQLNVSGWAGEGVLEHVSVRPDGWNSAMEKLPMLPKGVRIRSGHAQRIRVRVPWTALRSQPMLIIVEKLTLMFLCLRYRRRLYLLVSWLAPPRLSRLRFQANHRQTH